MKYNSAVLLSVCIILSTSCNQEKLYPDSLSPDEALESFQLHEGFEIEVFAAEPHVKDPVEMVFDESGNVYVVEMPDYPYKPKEGEAAGRIKMLIDTDHDGKIDDSVVFADKLSEATSVLPWKDGLLVTSAPNILYLKDTDGDHQADYKETLFTGFFENNSEAQITNLRYSVDNWIYAANHGQAGEVSFSRNPDAPKLSMRGGDFRFRLDRGQFELASGPGQFGHTIDDWGHRFITQNTIHIRHAVIPKRYLDRHVHLPSSNAALNISDHDLRMYQQTPAPYWRAERTRRRQKQYDEQGLDRVEYEEDHFTGASGGTIYTGDAFPEEYYGNIFTGDVAGNLIHRDVLIPMDDSPTFVAQRHESETDKEFLASTDPWFRPVNFTVGPDGYLYVIDMYRQHIETPLSIPEDLKEDMDFLNGSDMGRIYRIKPVNAESKSKIIPKLKEMETQKLAELLSHPNQWWRLQAQRLMLERQDLTIVSKIESIFQHHQDPRVRLHALYVLEGLNSLKSQHVKEAMQDTHPGVREHSIILAERFPEMLPQIVQCLKDSASRVAFQASLSLGNFENDEIVPALAEVVKEKGADPWFKASVFSSEPGASFALMRSISEDASFFQQAEPWKLSFVKDISYAIGSKNDEQEVAAYLILLKEKQEDVQQAVISGLIKGLKKNDGEEVQKIIENIEADVDMQPKAAIEKLNAFYKKYI